MTEPRQESSVHWQHVTARCVDGRRVIVRFGECAGEYLDRFGEVALRRRWLVVNYCVMGNHVHLLLRTPDADLGRGMKVVQEGFAIYANHRDGLLGRGHFWSGRYRNELVQDEHHAAAAMRYVARNPVHHEVRERPDAWPHSAHRALVGAAPCPEWLDRDVALQLVGGARAYEALTAKNDRRLAAELIATFGPAEGVRRAIDVHWIEPVVVIGVMGCSERTFYRRLRDGRLAHRLLSGAATPALLTKWQ